MLLALANFMVVLDTTIANVSVPNIAGDLAVSPSQGTWVITSYAVAEAITVPLTGWLAQRFGAVRIFVVAMAGLRRLLGAVRPGAIAWRCWSLFRVLQGLCGGPMMPLSQTLLLRDLPARAAAPRRMGLWAMTTLVGADRRARSWAASSPTTSAGPGSSSSTCRWRLVCGFVAWRMLRSQRDADRKRAESTSSAWAC